MKRAWFTAAAFFAGVGLIATGFYLWSPGLCYAFVGLTLIGVAMSLEYDRTKGKPQ